MKGIVFVGLVMTGILASCGQQTDTLSSIASSSWTQEEVNAVQDLSELGAMSFRGDKLYLGDKIIDPAFTVGKFYGKNTVGRVSEDEIRAQASGYNVSASQTNLYAQLSGCISPFGRFTFKNLAATQPNRTSYYLAVDSSIYINGSLKAKDFKVSGGTSGARTSGVTLEVEVADAACYVSTDPEGRGYHKGIEKSGESSVITNTSDKAY